MKKLFFTSYLVLLTIIIFLDYCHAQQESYDSLKLSIDHQLQSTLNLSYQAYDIVEVDKALGLAGFQVIEGEIEDPFGTLEHCVLFTASPILRVDDTKNMVGIFKNGAILWHSDTLLYGVIGDIYGTCDLNLDGAVDIISVWDRGSEMWIHSWDGTQGWRINAQIEGESKIISVPYRWDISDVDGDGILEIRNEDMADGSLAWSWNGQEYGRWANTPIVPFTSWLPAKSAVAEVKCKIVKEDTIYRYEYTVKNKLESKRRIKNIHITVNSKAKGYTLGSWHSTGGDFFPIVSWDMIGLDYKNMLRPGEQKSGFIATSKGLPGINTFYIQSERGLMDVDYDLNGLRDDIVNNSTSGITIAPAYPPSLFNSLSFLDTLKSYTTQSRTLGWIANQTTANKYLEYFDTAKVRIQRGENKYARNSLLTVLQNANQDSSGLLTSEAYALIRFNTEYLIDNLPGVVTLPSSVNTGWNMISVPVDASRYIKSELYPQSTSNAFIFQTDLGYIIKDTLSNGVGYWLKLDSIQSIKYTGFQIDLLSIDVQTGWNMIGSISSSLDTSKVKSIPSGIILSKFFGYNLGYFLADSIMAGKGYWVKVSQSGKIILDKNAQTGGGQWQEPLPPPPPGSPDIPNLYSPDNGSTGISKTPTLIWFSSIKAQTYRLQVSTNSTFTNLVFDDSTLTATSKQIGTLANSTTYYWRVNAKNEIWTSDWSSVFWFRTLGTPPPPDPCQPIDAFSAMDQFTVSDNNGNKQQLFAHNGGRRLALGLRDYDMPPEPIEGVFHAKFQSGKFVEGVPPGKGISKIPVKIKDANFPITISWNIRPESNTKYWLYKSGRDKILLSGVGSTTINNIEGNVLLIEAQAIAPEPCY